MPAWRLLVMMAVHGGLSGVPTASAIGLRRVLPCIEPQSEVAAVGVAAVGVADGVGVREKRVLVRLVCGADKVVVLRPLWLGMSRHGRCRGD
jgi:hypothetical protein